MSLVSMRQLLDHAAENGYGLPAFNVNNLEQVQAIMLMLSPFAQARDTAKDELALAQKAEQAARSELEKKR